MSRQQDYVEELRRSMHDDLVQRLRRRQRNIVFPDTVRNVGIFLRNLASKVIYAKTSHRIFAVFYGLFYLVGLSALATVFIFTLGPLLPSDVINMTFISLYILVGLKITVNAVIREDEPKPQLSKTYPRVKI
ncbi:MAG TPA: hypothetical protein VK129_03715 [Terriglobales bacterium]|nr:hypothetical protein [Terriglobales bacterium]